MSEVVWRDNEHHEVWERTEQPLHLGMSAMQLEWDDNCTHILQVQSTGPVVPQYLHCFTMLKMFQQNTQSRQLDSAWSHLSTQININMAKVCNEFCLPVLLHISHSPDEVVEVAEVGRGWRGRSWPWSGRVPWEGGRGRGRGRGRRDCCPGSSLSSAHWGTCCPLRVGERKISAGFSFSLGDAVTIVPSCHWQHWTDSPSRWRCLLSRGAPRFLSGDVRPVDLLQSESPSWCWCWLSL